MKSLPNIHPGEVLLEEFLVPFGIRQNALAGAAGVRDAVCEDVACRRFDSVALRPLRPARTGG